MILSKSNYAAIAFAVLVAIAAIGMAFVNALPASANPLGFFRTSSVDGVATTTLVYMSAGTATTTKYYDTGSVNALAADNATLAVQFTGSSTASSLAIAFEYANTPLSGANCRTTPTACDWYGDNINIATGATTTASANISLPNTFALNFASTTQGGAAGTSARTNRLINLQTPARYVRAVITQPAGSLSGGVWAEFVGKKQTP